MTLLRLAGFSSVRVTSQWQGTEAAPSEAELTVLRNVAGAAQLSAVRVYLSVYPTGSRVTPLTPEARELFAAYVTSLKQQLPSIKDVIIGNEPNINRFWLPQFNPNGTDAAAPAYTRSPRPLLRRRQGGRPGDARLGWRARAAGHRPSRHRARHALAGRVPQGHGHRLPGERAHAADHGRARVPSVRRHVGPVAGHAPPQLDHDRPRRLRPPDADARDRVRQLTPGRLAAADPLRRVRGRVEDPGGQGVRSTRAPSRRRRSPSTRSPRARTTRRRSSSRSASRT